MKTIRKSDLILIAVLLIIAAAAYAGIKIYGSSATDKAQAVIKINGREYKRLSLDKDTELVIETDNGNYNKLIIKNGMANIEDASCPDKLCVHQKAISSKGEMLVCLPNKVTVEIENGKTADVDAVSQ